MKDINDSEEVDITNIITKVKNIFVNVFQSIGGLLKYSLENIKTLFVFIFLFVGISIGIYYLIKPVYTTRLSLSHSRLNNDNCYQLVSTLEILADDEENSAELAQKLNISNEDALQIKNIKYVSLNQKLEKLFEDSVETLLPFKIEVQVYNTGILDGLEKGIVDYFENNEYALKRKLIKKQSLDRFQSKIHQEILALDSLKRIVNESIIPRSSGTGIILGEPINPITVYQKAMDMYNYELSIQEKQQLNNSFEVIEGFTKFLKPTWPKLWLNILLGSIAGYVFGLLWTLRSKTNKD